MIRYYAYMYGNIYNIKVEVEVDLLIYRALSSV